MRRTLIAFAVLAAAASTAALVQQQAPITPVPIPDPAIEFDNVKSNWVNYETHTIRMGFTSDLLGGHHLFVLNQPGMRLVVVDLDTGTRSHAIPIGPGVTAIVPRPGTTEVWAVDSVTHAVSVIDVARGTIVRTIPLAGREPHGLAFHPSGDRAYVACSASNSVEVLRTSDYTSAQSIAIPALHPRAVVFADGKAWVVPFTSGNNTTSWGANNASSVDRVVKVTAALGLNPLPDRDLLAIVPGATPEDDVLDGNLTVTGLGSNLFNLHLRPGSDELWIPNTDARNWEFVGEKNFPAGQVVFNRLAVRDLAAGTSKLIDLDQSTLGGKTCAQPTGVAFSADGSLAYVACYGTDVVAVVRGDDPGAGWKSYYTVPGATDPDTLTRGRSGPRTLWLDQADDTLYVFNKGDNSYSTVDLATASAGDAAAGPFDVGFDPTPRNVRRGRFHFTSGLNSASGTSSCASCHPDGHLDGLVWELSRFLDPEGTAVDDLNFPMDQKGPMLTQSTRSLADSGPYHWRGEQRTLEAFNDAFPNLLDRPGGKLPDEQFAELEDYVFSLVYRANPRQEATRDYTGDVLAGHDLFVDHPSVGSLTCADCHTLPTGTNGELQRVNVTQLARSTQVTQLRALQDRLGEGFVVDPDPADGFLGPRTEQGSGTTHAATFGTIADFVEEPNPGFPTAEEREQVVAFMQALDTGLAPCTAWQATAVPGGGAAFIAGELADIEGQAIAGNCDIAVFAHWVDNHGDDQTVNLAWNHALQEYHLPSLATIAGDELVNFVTANQGHATFVGLPLGNMHWRSALDTDFEGLPDAAEIGQYGTAPDDRDTDGDGFSDWHEVVNEGMDPLVYNDFSTDETPPEFSVEPVATLTTTNTVKIEFQTNEPTRAVLTWGETTVTSPPVGVEDISHSMIVGGLPADTEVDLFVEIFDPADNRDSRHVLVTTDERIVPEVLTIHDLELVDHDPGAGTATVDVHLGTQLGTTPDGVYLSAAHVYYEDDANGLAVVDKNVVGCVVPLGDTIRYDVEDIPFGGAPESRKLHVTVWEVLHCPPIGPPFPLPLPSCLDILVDCLQQFPGKLIYVEGDDIENFATFDVP